MLPARECADQKPRDIGVEHRPRRRLDEARELAIVLRRAEPAPVAKNMDVRAFTEQSSLADTGKSWIGPRRDRVGRKRRAQSGVMRFLRLRADACAGAAAHLAREARTGAPLESKRIPAQRVLARELTQGFARRPLRREGAIAPGEIAGFDGGGRIKARRPRLARAIPARRIRPCAATRGCAPAASTSRAPIRAAVRRSRPPSPRNRCGESPRKSARSVAER